MFVRELKRIIHPYFNSQIHKFEMKI